MPPELQNWNQLRTILRSQTQSPESKLALSKHLGVTLAAVSQWRSGAAKPSADKTLQILAWVGGVSGAKQQKKRAERASTRPALRTRESKSNTNEKAPSGFSEKQ